MNVYTLLLLMALPFLSLPLSFKIANKTCLRFEGGGLFNLQYACSGEDPQKIKLQVYENNQLKLTKEGVIDFAQKLSLMAGEVSICFEPLSKRQKLISFDFYREDDPFKALIDKKDFQLVLRSLYKAIDLMKDVGRHQQYHIEGDEINKTILQKSQVKIKWTGIIKIFFLLASALIQLWIMKGFFKQNSIPYQPVEQ